MKKSCVTATWCCISYFLCSECKINSLHKINIRELRFLLFNSWAVHSHSAVHPKVLLIPTKKYMSWLLNKNVNTFSRQFFCSVCGKNMRMPQLLFVLVSLLCLCPLLGAGGLCICLARWREFTQMGWKF